MIRSHGMSTGELGTWLALILGLGGAIGVFGGGLLTDRLSRKDVRWSMWLPALAGIVSLPFGAYVYLAEGTYTALAFAIIPGILSSVFLAATIATAHSLVGLRMRALSSAVVSFIVNMIGLGAGPFTIGLLSDLFEPTMGVESLRYAMLYTIPVIQSEIRPGVFVCLATTLSPIGL